MGLNYKIVQIYATQFDKKKDVKINKQTNEREKKQKQQQQCKQWRKN